MTDTHPLTIDSERKTPGHRNLTGGTQLTDSAGQSFNARHTLWSTTTVTTTCKGADGSLSTNILTDDSFWKGADRDMILAVRDTIQQATFSDGKGHPLSIYDIRKQFDTGTPLQPRTPKASVTVNASVVVDGKEVGVLDAICAHPAIQAGRAQGKTIEK